MTECEVLFHYAQDGDDNLIATAMHVEARRKELGSVRFDRLVRMDSWWPGLKGLLYGVDTNVPMSAEIMACLAEIGGAELWRVRAETPRNLLRLPPRFEQTNPKPAMIEVSENGIKVSALPAYVLTKAMRMAASRDDPSTYPDMADALQSALADMGVSSIIRTHKEPT